MPATPAASASASAPITAAAGGSVTATLGAQSVRVTFAPGGLSANATVTVTLYAGAGLPRPFAAAQRRPLSVPSGAAFLAGIGIDAGGVAVQKPPSIALSGAAPPAGTTLRLAGSAAASFGDIDTATAASGVVTNDNNPAYAGPSLAAGGVLYAFYAVAAAAALPPPAITVAINGPPTVAGGVQVAYLARETDAGGFPVPAATFAFAVDTPSLGTIDPANGVLTPAAASNAHGNVVATDTRFPARTGSLAVQSFGFRPAAAADALTYAGTVSRSIANAAISPGSPVTQTERGSVTQTVTVAAGSAPGQFVLNSDEIDTLQLRTLETKTTSTVAYQPSGALTNVRVLQAQATDSNNAVYATTYTPTSGLMTVLPENLTSFGPNDASSSYAETDPGVSVASGSAQITTQRTTHADGSYSETTTNDDASVNLLTVNPDMTGSYVFAGGVFRVTVDAVVPATATAAAFIPLNIARANGTGGFLAPQTVHVPAWYPSGGLFAESDAITPNSAFDPTCSVPARFGTTGNKVEQSMRRFDPVLGTIETFTSDAYDVAGVGTACLVLSDTVTTNYDYTRQEGNIALNIAFPVLTSAYAETLSLTSAAVAGQPAGTRGTSSVQPVTSVAAAFARAAFLHAVRLDRTKRVMLEAQRARAAVRGAVR